MKKENCRGVCVCCPHCARFHERSVLADSIIKCTKCGCMFAAKVMDGKVTTFVTEGDDELDFCLAVAR